MNFDLQALGWGKPVKYNQPVRLGSMEALDKYFVNLYRSNNMFEVTRSEELVWKFVLDKEQAEECVHLLEDIPFRTPLEELMGLMPNDDDTLTTTYTLHINYIGQVCKALNAIVKLQEAGVIIDCDEKELNHGHCLIRDVFASIDKVQKQVKKQAKKDAKKLAKKLAKKEAE